MANMDATQREQMERVELSVPSTGVQLRSRKGMMIYTLLAVPILAVLAYAAFEGVDDWAQGLVLAVIVITVVGVMIAISPNRRGW